MNSIITPLIVITITLSFNVFFWMSLRKMLIKSKETEGRIFNELSKMQDILQEQVLLLDRKFDEQYRAMKSLKGGTTIANTTKDSIENNYERAKNLLQRGVAPDNELFRNANITEEEFQLLATLQDN